VTGLVSQFKQMQRDDEEDEQRRQGYGSRD